MKILVPFDFSKESVNALELAKELAENLDTEIKILHALNYPKFEYFNTVVGEELIEKLKSKAKADIDELLHKMHFNKSRIEVEISKDKAAAAIIKSTYDNELLYTIIGKKEQVIPKKVGSTTRDIIRYARGAVICVKNKVTLRDFNDLLVITDFSNTPIKASGRIKTIQELNQSKITFLYVNTKENWMSTEKILEKKNAFCKTHNFINTKLEIIDAESLEMGVAHLMRREKFDLVGIKIRLFENNYDIVNTHLSIERMLHNIDTPVLSYTHRPEVFN